MEKRTEIALFRYQVIAPLLSLRGPKGELKRAIESIVARTHDHPTKGPVRLGYGTVEDWLYAYRKGGLSALEDRPRRDRGQSRVIDDELAEVIETLARQYPDLDGPGLLFELKGQRLFQFDKLPSLSSLYRFLKAKGLDQRRAPLHKDHRAFVFDLAGDCWQCDVMYGPTLPTREGTRRKVHSKLVVAVVDASTSVVMPVRKLLVL